MLVPVWWVVVVEEEEEEREEEVEDPEGVEDLEELVVVVPLPDVVRSEKRVPAGWLTGGTLTLDFSLGKVLRSLGQTRRDGSSSR